MVRRRLLPLLVALVVLGGSAAALEPERREAVVVAARVWDGHDYRATFVPSTIAALTLFAGRDSAILFARTEEYYWPLARQVYADFRKRREPVEGVLVVREHGRERARLSREVFAVHYPHGAAAGQAELLWGAAAERAHAEHRAAERDFVRAFWAARQAQTAFERQLIESAAEARRTGRPPEPVPPPPPPPEPLLRLVTPPEPGFRISLPPGDYTVELEHAGSVVPGTRRRLRVVDIAEARVVVADVVPAERWTRPLPANSPEARIFVRRGATFYVTLTEASRFAETDYLPVVAPQAQPIAGRTVWVRRGPAAVAQLEADWRAGGRVRLTRGAYRVEQTAGTGFGYRIRPAEQGERPDLEAFAVAVPDDPALRRGRLADPSGAVFRRAIVVVPPAQTGTALAFAFLPLAAYAALRLVRRARGRALRPAG